MTHSNDSRDKTGAGLTNIKENVKIFNLIYLPLRFKLLIINLYC